MHFIDIITPVGASDQQHSVADEKFRKLLEAVDQGDLKTVKSTLAKYPELLNWVDKPQKNTLLHYAVAQHDLALIEFLIYQGANVTIKNQQGETAAKWYEEFIASRYKLKKLFDTKDLLRLFEKNDVRIIENYIKGGLSGALRFSRGRLMLHWAVELQRPAIVKLILGEIAQENITQILNLKDSLGWTPLTLAQRFYQNSFPTALEILKALQEKGHTAAPSESTLINQPLPTAWLSVIDKDFKSKINYLSNKLKVPITLADFAALNPLREVICQLAYITCLQVLSRLSSLKRYTFLEEKLLHNLFGSWCSNTQLKIQKKLQAIVVYLDNLIQKKQVDQVIHFSNEIPHASGWCCFEEKKIYLNPMAKKANLLTLVIALIHETTHWAIHSYDFAKMAYFIDNEGCTINFNQACQLASTGEAKKLTPEQVKLFELRQLLHGGLSPDWRQQLNHWMALNNADTQTLAILLLATLPEGYAKFNKKEQTLLIKPQFLSAEYLNKHPTPLPFTTPSPQPLQLPQAMAAVTASVDQPVPLRSESGNRSKVNVAETFTSLLKKLKGQHATNPGSPSSDFSDDSTDSSRTLSPLLQLPQMIAAQTTSPPAASTQPNKRSLSFANSLTLRRELSVCSNSSDSSSCL
jgi:ankyrin repeat protein